MEDLLDADYVNELCVTCLAMRRHSLTIASDADFHSAGKPADPTDAPSQATSTSTHVRKVSASSDFAPVNLKIKRRKRKDKLSKYPRDDWTFIVLRWPLLAFIFLFIAAELGLYVFLRQLVNLKEWISAWRGKRGLLRKNLRVARNYEEWKEAAKQDAWKQEEEDLFYDFKLTRRVHRSLKTLREKNDVRGCLGILETCMRPNFAAVESPRVIQAFLQTFLGTKDLIEAYYEEQERALELIRESPELTIDEKKRFFRAANTNLGNSALCLSGGASFGYYHCGVVKAFLDASLMPRVITGSSAGGLIAALCCTRTDAELKLLLVPELAYKITACEDSIHVWSRRLWKTGARFDPILYFCTSSPASCAFFTRGSLTFKEAYLRTGRILNISVIPADRHSPTRLLNYLTAPDTLIWSALLASAAIPGVLPPVVLMQKLRDGSAVPWNWGSRFKDGSLRVDVPIQGLHTYFNVTFPIVSQVNPHVHLFFFTPRGSAGKPVADRKGWRGNFILSAAEQWLKHELTKNFRVIRDLELLPQLLGQDWSSVFLQRFEGNVTILPRTRLWDWIRILSDPDPTDLERMMDVGQSVTWPKLHMIENRAKLERQIYLGRQHVRNCLKSKAVTTLPERTHTQHATTPPPSGSDRPLSVDTDAEKAFTHKSRSFHRNRHSGTSTPRDPSRHPDPLRSPATRRKWASSLLNVSDNNQTAHPLDTPDSDSGGFLSRLRPRSFSTFATLKEIPIAPPEDAWSSDSSFEDDLDLLLKISENILSDPDNTKFHQFKPTNSVIKHDLIDPKCDLSSSADSHSDVHVLEGLSSMPEK
ncbi:acyl transferase/acyl hydrolase/lysophospholipase [Mycena pura]|uniref:Acyl transferase/acyl hydrolase/lysophospholipase n=1 Tax=Mycena pura TaxID=153505 RepID=A0AAD6YT88_9AGAR|nr:acyl transferase/acyl hydrolase/lysophospholipase [Mycena pura]